VAGDDAIAGDDLLRHPEVETTVGDELVDLFEGTAVEQQVDALARGQLARLTLAAQPFFAAPELGASIEVGESFVH
jgi:hypothetical protein